MPKSLNPASKRPNPRDYLPFPRISIFISTVLGMLIAVVGTAWTFTLAFKPQPAPKASVNDKIALKSPILEPTLSQPFTPRLKPTHPPIAEETPAQHPASYPVAFKPLTRTSPPTPSSSSLKLRLQGEGSHLTCLLECHWVSNAENAPLAVYPFLSQETGLNSVQMLQNLPTQHQEIAPIQTQKTQQTQPIADNPLTENQPKPVAKSRAIKLTLSDVVILALENNRPIKNAYLERIAQKQELAVAEDKFSPDFTPTVSISIAQLGTNRRTTDADLGIGATVSVKVPTGGELSFRWATNGQTVSQNGLNLDINDDPFSQNLQLSFNQPLLRGFGVNVNRASVDIARLTEQVNILDLKSTLSNTITEAILAYRELIRAQEQLKIAQISLQRAEESLANNRILIESGRLAPVDIVQSETEVARRQVSLIEAENNLEAARLRLVNIVDIEPTAVIVATDSLIAPAVSLNSDNLRQLAFENQPDYLKAQLDLERTKLALLQAENNRLWDLNLNTSYGYASNNTSDVRIGLGLSRQIGDLTVERDFQRRLVNQIQAENTLTEQRESLDIQLIDRIRNVNLSFAQVELAKKVTESSEKQLEIAREKQRLGRDITVFELIRLQDDLVQARNVELNAIINYLNALTRLDQTLGTTLDTWQVKIDRQ
ncbi:TolC family protein [Allocoleopsis franciscana]|uniref:Outer membrane protein n=1 Tax=Allocoleopsis franciscana PCC 7113 TaxID=1173027 RepID=K9WC97_9CYAN|nr:TolC family protein [Allocoleopsis franciscana]AFZ17436.1 outer membrane protein [Allocoleopsis franciscana PCC 7113]